MHLYRIQENHSHLNIPYYLNPINNKVPINFQIVYQYFNNLPYYKIAMGLNIPLHINN